MLQSQASPYYSVVASSPVNVSTNRTALDEVTVMWDAPSPAPDGYEVFYQVDDDDIILSGGTTNNTELTLTGEEVTQTLSCFVVAFSTNTIPSARSNAATALAGECIIIVNIILSIQ